MEAKAAGARRLVPLDLLRGLVMVLMAVDHSSGEFNRGRLITDGVFMWHPGTPLPTAQFLTRWMTHLCAPTFVFLAGTSLALSAARRDAKGEAHAAFDRHLLLRGLFIVCAECVPSYFWMPPGKYLFQVLYGIGTSYLFMIPLRRLPTAALAGLGAAILGFGEALTDAFGWSGAGHAPLAAALLLVPGAHGRLIVAYPTLYWLAIMVLGFVFGRFLVGAPSARRVRFALVGAGTFLLALFVLVRGRNGYGNMGVFREGDDLVQWLHVSKYPPSISFAGLELGIAALVLALLFLPPHLESSPAARVFLVFGRTPMFFYLLHIPLLALTAEALHLKEALGLGAAYGFAALAVALLYPACSWYGGYKAAHPGGIVRYV